MDEGNCHYYSSKEGQKTKKLLYKQDIDLQLKLLKPIFPF